MDVHLPYTPARKEDEWKNELENKRRQFWLCCHMLSGNCQAGPLFGVVDAG